MGDGRVGVGGLMLSGRCGWRRIKLIAILETLGICFLSKLRKHVVEPGEGKRMEKSQELVQGLAYLENPIQVGLGPGRKSDL